MPTGEGGCWQEHPKKGMWMAMSEWPPAHPEEAGDESGGQDARRKAGGGGMEKPKSGCPQKVSAEQYEARHSLRFREMPCASSQKPLSEAWAVLRVKE